MIASVDQAMMIAAVMDPFPMTVMEKRANHDKINQKLCFFDNGFRSRIYEMILEMGFRIFFSLPYLSKNEKG